MPAKRPRTHPALSKLRKLVKTFPDSGERVTWGHPTFRVGEKIFASFGEHEGAATIGCKQTKDHQAFLLQDDRFFFSPYVGKHGWVGILVDEVDWPMVAELVENSYRLIAPKRAVKALDESRG